MNQLKHTYKVAQNNEQKLHIMWKQLKTRQNREEKKQKKQKQQQQ